MMNTPTTSPIEKLGGSGVKVKVEDYPSQSLLSLPSVNLILLPCPFVNLLPFNSLNFPATLHPHPHPHIGSSEVVEQRNMTVTQRRFLSWL
ncbi:hypothetical protein L1887_05045 [Cichorium endivia]|nr:hypothetical protein L1887_05045 [Cichorium endivia]